MSSLAWLAWGMLTVVWCIGWRQCHLAERRHRWAQDRNRQRWLRVRDALQALGPPASMAARVDLIQAAVVEATGYRVHWVEPGHPSEANQAFGEAPFFVEPHLVDMARRSRRSVSSAALAPLGWACAYIPLCVGEQDAGVLVLAAAQGSPAAWRPEDLACCEILAQGLAACWSVSLPSASDGTSAS